jgi:Cu+-exporting ATPase
MSTLTLDVGGMTCASCAARIEKRLNRIDGVQASVNFATEQARVDFPDSVSPEDLVAAVEATGYTAALPPEKDAAAAESGEPDESAPWRQRLLISAALALPVVVLSMVPVLQFTNWQWLAFTLASPVVVWGAWPFHTAAWTNLRHGAATMDTLISAVRADLQQRRTASLSGGRRGGDHLPARRALLRGPRQTPVRCRAAGTAAHGRQGCRVTAWRR